LNKGRTYRLGQRIKDCGEKIGHVRIFGIRVFNWFAGPVIRLGLAVKDSVKNNPIGEM
jgi:hypothetical protein